MSYFNYPRLHFSGRYKASPSTINNTPNNFDPAYYPTPNELEKVELYWNPRGDGGFEFVDCVVTRIDYLDGTSSTSSSEDSIIGQAFSSPKSAAFPLAAGLVDLDPMQQNVSELWGLSVRIGGVAPAPGLSGNFIATSFAGIWGQAKGPNAPQSSASGAAIYQSTLTNLRIEGSTASSRFLQHFENNPESRCSINFNLNAHNNAPPVYRFNSDTFNAMRSASPPVPDAVLTKMLPMQRLVMTLDSSGNPVASVPRGDVPAEDFVVFMLKQYLTVTEFNTNIDSILAVTRQPYRGASDVPFLYGRATGTIGPAGVTEPNFFVANRMMNPITNEGVPSLFFAPFVVTTNGQTIQLNLGNSLPVKLPGFVPWAEKLGDLYLVALPGGVFNAANAQRLLKIDYSHSDFISGQAGMLTASLNMDCSETPLGVMAVPAGSEGKLVLAEQSEGYYLRADQFVYRMNPGVPTTPEFPRGETATVKIHALKFGQAVADGTPVVITMKTEQEAEPYTKNTLGTSGTNGIERLSVPQDALKINQQTLTSTVNTRGGIAKFDLSCVSPGNPRKWVDGQIYFLNYGFSDPAISSDYVQDPNDIISVQVYDDFIQQEPAEILNKFGRLYKIMNFLTDESSVLQIDRRNMIKLLLEKPMTDLKHMPVTRDLSEAARVKIVNWINHLNSR